MVAADRDYLSDEDISILRLESPAIAGHTCKVVTIDAPPGRARLELGELRRHIASRLDHAPRLRRKLSSDRLDQGRLYWVSDGAFDIDDHVRSYEVPRPVDDAMLLEITAELMSTRLDRLHALWSIHCIDLAGERLALVWLMHHCMVDGMTAVKTASEVLWDEIPDPGGPVDRDHPPTRKRDEPEPVLNLRASIHRELLPAATETPLDRHPTRQRVVSVVSARLTELKRVGHEAGLGATVNDVVLCAVAGGLRGWLERHGGSLEGVRVKVPVSLHDHDPQSNDLGNHDSFMVVDIDTEEPDPVARLRSISARTRELKRSHDAQSLDRVFSELRYVSSLAARVVSKWAGSPHVFTVNVSNVPGPRTPVEVMKGRVSEMFTLAEIGDRHALRVSVISLADQVTFGLCADAVAVDDPNGIAAGIESDLAALSAA